jgi:hypothetical protein
VCDTQTLKVACLAARPLLAHWLPRFATWCRRLSTSFDSTNPVSADVLHLWPSVVSRVRPLHAEWEDKDAGGFRLFEVASISSHNRYLYTAVLLLISMVCSVKSCMLSRTNTSYSRGFALDIGATCCRHPVLESHLESCAAQASFVSHSRHDAPRFTPAIPSFSVSARFLC